MNDQQMIDQVRTLLEPVHPPPHLRGKVIRKVAASVASAEPTRVRTWKLAVVAAAATTGVLALLVGAVVSIGGEPPAASAQAAEILYRAADAARADPNPIPRSDQFILTTTKGFAPVVGQDEPAATTTRSWMSVDGTRDGLIWVSDPPPGGRQSTVIPGCRNGRAAEWAPDGTLLDSTRPCAPAPAHLDDLPTDATRMVDYLQRMNGGAPSDEQMFANVGVLIRRGYLPASTRAALYEAATRIPGVVAIPTITDGAGRSGTGVSLVGKIDRYDLIFDPQTYRFLGWQVVSKAENAVQPSRREVIINVVVVDRAGQVP
ncbi:CU044_5270 family protein [Micromonospora sp. WMMA1363]|uniref:CU044_5270 family protein n=1 Tax=Micromonospora sp. WMMA1363 TaxID=3053985 RepID=UPI00259CE336|nr:CU044_5270 family protein [Micromonospora sp. WMMA1363]MDM4719173.1 CU044_5270 family protein [Micromonospora sp. WMMA1363]